MGAVPAKDYALKSSDFLWSPTFGRKMLRKSPKCQGPSAMEIRIGNNMASSVGRGAGGGGAISPHWPVNQNAE